MMSQEDWTEEQIDDLVNQFRSLNTSSDRMEFWKNLSTAGRCDPVHYNNICRVHKIICKELRAAISDFFNHNTN